MRSCRRTRTRRSKQDRGCTLLGVLAPEMGIAVGGGRCTRQLHAVTGPSGARIETLYTATGVFQCQRKSHGRIDKFARTAINLASLESDSRVRDAKRFSCDEGFACDVSRVYAL